MKILLAALAATASMVPIAAEAQTGQISVAFASETENPVPGKTTMLVFKMKPKAGWHGYWRNPGEAGGETQFRWKAPKGVVFGKPLWGAPIAQTALGMTSYIMDGDYSVLVPMTLPSDMKLGEEFSVSAKILLFVCTDGMCSSQNVDGSVDLVAGDGRASETGAPLVAEAKGWLPKTAKAKATQTDGQVSLSLAGTNLDPAKTRIFLSDRAAPVTAQQGLGAASGEGATFSLAWAPKGALEGVASDGKSAWAFNVTPEKVSAHPAAAGVVAVKPNLSSRAATPSEEGYVAAAADRHFEPDVTVDEGASFGACLRAAMAAAFLAAAGMGVLVMLSLRKKACTHCDDVAKDTSEA